MPDTYGKIIRNGVNFSHDTAESISYDKIKVVILLSIIMVLL